jgi:hypothetical protein
MFDTLLMLAGVIFCDPAVADNCNSNSVRCRVEKVRVGGPQERAQRTSFDRFDHSRFDALLHRFVDCKGQVCYRAWKCDCAAMSELHDYVTSLGTVDAAAKASKAGELAFYINAYNALAIWGILQEYPTPSIQLHNRRDACYRIFDDLEVWIDGEYLSLNAIENDRLRPLQEPRIHFALVCAAKGCPKLRNEAYVGDRLEEQLTDNSFHFFSRRNRFRINRLTGTVRVSPIFKWYKDDFGVCKADFLDVVMPYLRCRDQQWLSRHPCVNVKYLGYNWALNDRCPTLSVWFGRMPYAFYARYERLIRPWARAFGLEPMAGANGSSKHAEPEPVEPDKKMAPEKPTPPPPKFLEPAKPKLLDPNATRKKATPAK